MEKTLVGFSVNAEIVLSYDRMASKEKGNLETIAPYLCGTSANVARAITLLGQSSKVLALTGVSDDFESHVLHFALRQYLVPYSLFPILDSSHIAILPVDNIPNPQIFGKKGNIQLSKIKETVEKIENEKGQWRIATGVRPEEIELVKALFNGQIGYRSLNPRPELIANSIFFREILGRTDLLIMNHLEYDSCRTTSLSELHKYGPKLVVVTQNENGGMFSKLGCKAEMFEPCNDYVSSTSEIYGPGAGDWFHAAFIVRCLELGKSIDNLTNEEIFDCVSFAARVSGKKVTMKGAANGPTKEEL
jgi:hypothetical protein